MCDCGSGHSSHAHDLSLDTECEISLLSAIDLPGVRAQNNQSSEFPVSCILKNYNNRFDVEPSISSNDDDPELIIYIPFSEVVTISSLALTGGDNGTTPKTINIFVNRDDIDFSNCNDIEPTQTLNIVDPINLTNSATETLDYPLKPQKHQNVHSLTLFISENYDADLTTIQYLGLKGKSSGAKRRAVECVYESKANLADHKVPDEVKGGFNNVG